jgi:hypothetical protein
MPFAFVEILKAKIDGVFKSIGQSDRDNSSKQIVDRLCPGDPKMDGYPVPGLSCVCIDHLMDVEVE